MAEQKPSSYFETPYLYNGKALDAETGLYYYGARYYDPKNSFWLGVDPLAEKYPNINPYVYCVDNPVNMIDPDGRWPDFPFSFRSEFQGIIKGTINNLKQKYNEVKTSLANTCNQVKKNISKAIKAVTIVQKDGYEFENNGDKKEGLTKGFFDKAKGAKSSDSFDVEVLMVAADALSIEFKNKIIEGAKLATDLKEKTEKVSEESKQKEEWLTQKTVKNKDSLSITILTYENGYLTSKEVKNNIKENSTNDKKK